MDLGAAWTEWTGLPFAYALWMIRGAVLDNPELPGLCRDILAARDRAEEELPQLALEAASIFEIDPPRLLSYWRSVRYRYTDAMAEGLQLFLRHARNLDEIPAVPEIRYYRP
jgi:chorismate dehydratase